MAGGKAVQRVLTPLPPTAAQSSNTEHPYAFGKRQRVTDRTINLQALLTQLRTCSSP